MIACLKNPKSVSFNFGCLLNVQNNAFEKHKLALSIVAFIYFTILKKFRILMRPSPAHVEPEKTLQGRISLDNHVRLKRTKAPNQPFKSLGCIVKKRKRIR